MNPIRVALADDSSFVRQAIARILSTEPGFELTGSAASGEELLANLDTWQPGAIILDLLMPGQGGLATLDGIRARCSTPVIILSTHSRRGAPQTIEALHRGATDFIDKQQYSLIDFQALREALVSKLREVTSLPLAGEPPPDPPPSPAPTVLPGPIELLVIGASTGGPPAIERVLRELGEQALVPVVVVQHMPPGFTRAFADRLNQQLELEVCEATEGETLRPGQVVIAPGGRHLRVERGRGGLRTALSEHPQDASHLPSVDVLFASAAEVVADRAVGVLLTGMGQDGAAGMAALAGAGAVTLAQDEATCIVYGMPRAALASGGVREMLPLDAIGFRLRQILLNRRDLSIELPVREPGGNATMQPKKALVIDDSSLIHKMFKLMLPRTELITAFNGFEALQRLAENSDVELIFLDINMPAMNGLEFLAKVKQDATLAGIPVIIISTEGKEQDTLRGLQGGAAAYIRKPFRNGTVMDLIHRVLSQGEKELSLESRIG